MAARKRPARPFDLANHLIEAQLLGSRQEEHHRRAVAAIGRIVRAHQPLVHDIATSLHTDFHERHPQIGLEHFETWVRSSMEQAVQTFQGGSPQEFAAHCRQTANEWVIPRMLEASRTGNLPSVAPVAEGHRPAVRVEHLNPTERLVHFLSLMGLSMREAMQPAAYERIATAFRTLSPRQQQIVALRHLNGTPLEGLAAEAQRPEGGSPLAGAEADWRAGGHAYDRIASLLGLKKVAGVRDREHRAIETMALFVQHPEKLQELLRQREARQVRREQEIARLQGAESGRRRARLETREILVPNMERVPNEEAIRLAVAARAGDLAARQRLRTVFYPLAIHVANKVAAARPVSMQGGMSAGDMAHLAWEVIDWGIDHYEVARGIPFGTYLSNRMFGRLLDELRVQVGGGIIHVSREAAAKARAYERDHRLAQRGEAAPAFERDRKKRAFGVRASAALGMVSMDQRSNPRSRQAWQGKDPREIREAVAGRSPSPLQGLMASELSGPLMRAILQLGDKERLVLALHYFAGTQNQSLVGQLVTPAYRALAAERGLDLEKHHNTKELAGFLHLTDSRIVQLHAKAMGFLKEKLGHAP